jgi:hypothetical protein
MTLGQPEQDSCILDAWLFSSALPQLVATGPRPCRLKWIHISEQQQGMVLVNLYL